MDQAGLAITISADVAGAITGTQAFESELKAAQTELNLLGRAIDIAIAKGEDISALEDSFQKVNTRIKELRSNLQSAPSAGLSAVPGQLQDIGQAADLTGGKMSGMGLSTTQARIAFIDLGRIATGQGFSLRALASNFALLGPAATIGVAALYGLYEVLTKQSDAEKKAAQDAEKLKQALIDMKTAAEVTQEAIGSEAGNIDRVQALAAVIQDTNKAYSQRSTALKELQATNRSYFGDLTLEESSLKILADRVKQYSEALITEAVIKGQVDNIAKLSSTYEDQVKVLDKLKDARDRAQQEANIGQKNLPANIASEGEEAAAVQQKTLTDAVFKANDAFKEQQEAVDKLATQIASYRGELNQTIQVQTQQRPLAEEKDVDNAGKIKGIYEEIARIYAEIAKPSSLPLFQQNANSQTQSPIVKAIEADISGAENALEKAADDPKLQQAYRELLTALSAKLSHTENPDLHVRFAFAKEDIDDKEVRQFHDNIGKQLTDYMHRLPPVKSDIKVDPNLVLQAKAVQDFNNEITHLLQGTTLKGFEQLGKDIGTALAGGLSSQDFFGGFLKLLGAGLEQLGTYALSIAPLIAGIKTALKTLDPTSLLIDGVGMIALGSFLEAEASKSIKAFATGGIVTGPTLGLIGEAGPEVIFPLDRLNQFVKNMQGPNSQPVRVVGMIRGRDIAISNARDAKLQGMTS